MKNPERSEQIEQLFLSALERLQSQREAYLAEVCGGDESVRKEVESRLAYYEQAEKVGFLEPPAIEVATEIVVAEHAGLAVGLSFGPYTIDQLLGVGGMGEV